MVFLAILLALLMADCVWGAFALSRLRVAGLQSGKATGSVMAFLGLLAVTLIWSLLARVFGVPLFLPVFLLAAVYLWHLAILPATLLISAMAGIVIGGVWVVRRIARRPEVLSGTVAEPAPVNLSRRRLLTGVAVAGPPLALGLATAGAMPGLHDFAITQRDVPVPGLPAALEGVTIAHLSDTHLGDFSPGWLYEKMISATNDLAADLIVHTGDVINIDARDLPLAMAGLRRLSAPLGVFACEGNHDLIQNPRAFWTAMRSLPNVRFLRNETASLTIRGQAVQIMGARWGTGPAHGENEFAAACDAIKDAVDPGAFTILLGHHPHVFDHAPWARLTLSGHTHGGQTMLTQTVGPGPFMYRYWSGLYRKPGQTLVVSTGAGNWFPFRTPASRAEICKLTLRKT